MVKSIHVILCIRPAALHNIIFTNLDKRNEDKKYYILGGTKTFCINILISFLCVVGREDAVAASFGLLPSLVLDCAAPTVSQRLKQQALTNIQRQFDDLMTVRRTTRLSRQSAHNVNPIPT